MNYENKQQHTLGDSLRQLSQVDVPKDLFVDIQTELLKNHSVKKHRWLSLVSVAAVLIMAVFFVRQNHLLSEKNELLEKLAERTVQLEQLLAEESLTLTDPGSVITERIVNMEAWLAKLDEDIKNTRDKQKLSQLMAAKLNLLHDIVQLQRSVNNKPDYQKVKPFVI